MRLLVTTQAVDKNDPVLGFFHRWLELLAGHFESVEVICLRAGEHALPKNVSLHVLGSGTKILRAVRFLRLVFALERQYDRVFVHMNPEYIVLAGWYWRLRGKKIVLWYMHKAVNLRLRIAAFFANDILTASKESFRLPSRKLHIVGHGIDTRIFFEDPSVSRESWALSVGRLTTSKRHDLAIAAAHADHRQLRIAGDGPEMEALKSYAQKLGADVVFLGGVPHAQLGDLYRRAAYFIHTSETGSLDKVVLEALACGLPIRTNDPSLKFLEAETAQYVRENHSLERLIPRIAAYLS